MLVETINKGIYKCKIITKTSLPVLLIARLLYENNPSLIKIP